MRYQDVIPGMVYVIEEGGRRWLARLNVYNGDGFWNVTKVDSLAEGRAHYSVPKSEFGAVLDEHLGAESTVVESYQVIKRATAEDMYELLRQ